MTSALTHLGGFYFVPRGTAPSLEVWEDLALLSVQTWVHLTPPLLLHYGGCEDKKTSPHRFRTVSRFKASYFCRFIKPLSCIFLVLITSIRVGG